MWYLWSWRDLRRRSNAGHGLLNKPEITPPSHSNHRPHGTHGIRTGSLNHWHRLPSRTALLRLKGLQHACRLCPTTPKRQIALVREARAARLREHGHGLAKSESKKDGDPGCGGHAGASLPMLYRIEES